MFMIITALHLQLIYETPPRVYIPHGSVPVVFNDYMFKDEKTEECAERAQQILGVDTIDSTTIDTSVERGASKWTGHFNIGVNFLLIGASLYPLS